MSYIRKRGTKWYYTVSWVDECGKRRKSEHVGGLTKAACQKAWRKAMEIVDRTGMYRTPSERPFSECLEEWLKSIQRNYKPNTIDSYESAVRNHINQDLGNYLLKNLTTATLQTWLDDQRDSYSKSTVKTFYAVLKNFFRWALLNRKYIEQDPMNHVSIPRYFTLPKKTHVFTPAEMQAIFKHFGPSHTFYVPIMLAYCCGMRLGECLALTWDNVDFEHHTINVCSSQYDKKSLPKRGTPKSLTSIRTIVFGKKLYTALKQKQWQQKEALFKAGPYYTKSNLVCTDDAGQGLTANDLRYFGMWCKKNFGAGSFHGLRHTHATMLIESGMGIDYVSKRLGHSSMYTTANIYDDVTQKREEKAVQLMDKIL
jgi:integrase